MSELIKAATMTIEMLNRHVDELVEENKILEPLVIEKQNTITELIEENRKLREAIERSNFAFKANLASAPVKCEQSMIEALDGNTALLEETR